MSETKPKQKKSKPKRNASQVAKEPIAIRMLLAGVKLDDVADACGVSKASIVRWKRGERYKAALAQHEAAASAAVVDDAKRLNAVAGKAIAWLEGKAEKLDKAKFGEALEIVREVRQWTQSKRFEVTGKGGGAIEVDAQASTAELEAMLAEIVKADPDLARILPAGEQ